MVTYLSTALLLGFVLDLVSEFQFGVGESEGVDGDV